MIVREHDHQPVAYGGLASVAQDDHAHLRRDDLSMGRQTIAAEWRVGRAGVRARGGLAPRT